MVRTIEKFKNGLMIHLSQTYDGRTQVPIEINKPKVLQKVYAKLHPLQQEPLE